MTPRAFDAALAATRMDPTGSTARACRLVLVDGQSREKAAQAAGIDRAAVSRAVAKLMPRHRCPHCHGTGYTS